MENKRLERIEQKLDDMNQHLADINVTLAVQGKDLRAHMYRSDQLEDEFKPIRKQMYMIKGALSLLAMLASLGGVLEVIRMLK